MRSFVETWNVRQREKKQLYGPGLNVFNMSMAKAFTIPRREGIGVDSADAQNVFNHPSFPNPSTSLGGLFGRWHTIHKHSPRSVRRQWNATATTLRVIF